MTAALAVARWIDALNDRMAVLARWAIFAATFISAGNAFVRYVFGYSSNALLEIQWYLFTACVMFGAAQVLRVNEHVRVDVLYALYPTRAKVAVDLMGLAVWLLPVVLLLVWLSWPVALAQFLSGERSNNPGGLVRWPVTLMIPVGLGLLSLQAVSEIVKRVAWLRDRFEMANDYQRPVQ